MLGNRVIEQFTHSSTKSLISSRMWPTAQTALPKQWQRQPLAQGPTGQKLVIRCANAEIVSSKTLHRLVVLQRRMRQNNVEVVLKGLSFQARQMFAWTKLDRFFTIQP